MLQPRWRLNLIFPMAAPLVAGVQLKLAIWLMTEERGRERKKGKMNITARSILHSYLAGAGQYILNAGPMPGAG